MTENAGIILRGLVAWCENKRIDQVLGKWSAGADVNGFNRVDVCLVFEPSLFLVFAGPSTPFRLIFHSQSPSKRAQARHSAWQ